METNQKIGKNDVILIVALLCIGVAAFVGIQLWQGANTKNAEAVVFVNDKEYGRFPLHVDTVERIELSNGTYNLLEIKDGHADMIEASCPDKICVKHRGISKKGQSIVCLPNKVVVQIENGEDSDLDAITN